MCINHSPRSRQSGISLIELVLFIVIVSTCIVGILSVMQVTSKASADPMQRKQALAIAESLMEEIGLQSFTYCDPTDAYASTALSTTGCATTVQGLGPTAGQTRYLEPRFNNVADYHGFTMTGINDLLNVAVAGLGTYKATVTIVQDGARFSVAADEVLRIDVNVTTLPAGTTDFTLSSYRFRYAPRTGP